MSPEILNVGCILIGLVMLFYGGDYLVTGSIRLATRFKISPFVIGATVIGFGTSAPELAVSVLASLQGSGELALGNVIGSNIANVGLVLGLTSLLIPLTISEQRFKSEAPILLGVSLLILYLAWDYRLLRWEGGFMVVLLVVYLWTAFGKKEVSEIELEEGGYDWLPTPLLIIFGLILLVAGAEVMVKGATGIAREMGVSEWFIGVSIVAMGTSLPEIVSALIAAKRGHGEMAIGNVFGSNIFNILLVLGVASSIQPLEIEEAIHPDLIFTTAFICLFLVLIRLRHNLSRLDGVLLLLGYATYIGLKGAGVL
jgi:cation:H+ antiporter